MNLLFDLGHPAHFHLFKHTISALKDKGHKVIITAKKQPVLISLLEDSGFDYINIGQKGRSLPVKALKQIGFDLRILQIAIKNNIDLGIGVSVSVPHAALFCRMKSIILDDDDRSVTPQFYLLAHSIANSVLSPDCLAFQRGGRKYFYYKGYHELAYLHRKRYSPDSSVLKMAGISINEPFFILRFNQFGAYHDTKQTGLTEEQKKILAEKLLTYGKIFIIGEKNVSQYFKPYQLNIHPKHVLDLMAFATMVVGDSQTMTSEAALAGTPAIKCNTFAGRLSLPNELENKYRVCFSYQPDEFSKMLDKIDELLQMPNIKEEWQHRTQKIFEDKINVTAFLIWFVENYPGSLKTLKNDPDYQLNFK